MTKAEPLSGTVQRVTAPDKLVLNVSGGTMPVRLAGITVTGDAAAAEKLLAKTVGKTVTFQPKAADGNGSIICRVQVDGLDLSAALLLSRLAVLDKTQKKDDALEAAARTPAIRQSRLRRAFAVAAAAAATAGLLVYGGLTHDKAAAPQKPVPQIIQPHH
ncbi:MAG: hypothetical protein PW788_10640 [Micavibrio sp.]|nr:hypothetical protein [Micavibrio sp.]